jgi:hypothetical protein
MRKRIGTKAMKKYIIFKDLDMVNEEDESPEIDYFEAFAKNEDELNFLLDYLIEEGEIEEEFEIGTVIDAFPLNDFEHCLN